jgi:predicted dienelactone hydrolase
MTNPFTRILAARCCGGSVGLPNPAAGETQAAIPVALFYPTQAAAPPIVMGPFPPEVAMRAEPDAQVKGLIVLSHGTGGSALGRSRLAVALAGAGYLVAALRHTGDNDQDTSLLACGRPAGLRSRRLPAVTRPRGAGVL